ncbi:alpha-L-rhamnosidase [Microbacterium sp. MYb66]|uniref:alpha-L-rhamnosidase n=1 Tax=Microbacterium sp. MYb66 TaxID=1848692 RepID=UPI000CFFFC72|nr:alpha-L-rhamnosidase [Microbacterium sp. MYb66]PRA81106.1 alpha-L-rhamnosidase [Microbacterium sp. MYb66]
MSSLARVASVSVEHHAETLGIGTSKPRLAWTLDAPSGWKPGCAEARLEDATGAVTVAPLDAPDGVLAPWPFSPLASRERVAVRIRAVNDAGTDRTPWSAPLFVEAGLLDPADWQARPVSAPWPETPGTERRPSRMRRRFDLDGGFRSARLYISAHGVVDGFLNEERVGDDTLVPGWTSYRHRLAYRTYDVTDLLVGGENVFGAHLADGWYRGRLGYVENLRDYYGDDLALIAQLEVRYDDRTIVIATGEPGWEAATGPILSSSLYDGETYDARIGDDWRGGEWVPAVVGDRDPATLFAPRSAPVRRHAEFAPRTTTMQADGSILYDFGQNISGRLRLSMTHTRRGEELALRHAEVLEHGDLALRPLRSAAATDRYVQGGGDERWEPRFTMHGFRYATVTGWGGSPAELDVCAIAYTTQMRPTGSFETDNPLLNRFHENVRWGLLGNMVSLPTDCPQRDERLGWTADFQVFAPAASFLYDISGFALDWLDDLAAEQSPDGTVPIYVPWLPLDYETSPPVAAWGDAAVLVPDTLHERYGDAEVLRRHFETGERWIERVRELAGDDLIWDEGFQFGDWLDPLAPPDDPFRAVTSTGFVATGCFAHTAERLARIGRVIGASSADRMQRLADDVRQAFADRYLEDDGLPRDDTQTACAMVLQWNLGAPEHRPRVAERLAQLVRGNHFRIGTGFVGTPLVLDALADNGHLEDAYALLLQTECPSWLYAVTMGATTVWERWDSMLPDGSINPGSMTSFNHYALGAIADWLHRRVGGLEPEAAGYRRIRFAPRPGGGIASARTHHETPFGPASIEWRIGDGCLDVQLVVPTGATGWIDIEGIVPHEVPAGHHRFTTDAPLSYAAPMTLGRSVRA